MYNILLGITVEKPTENPYSVASCCPLHVQVESLPASVLLENVCSLSSQWPRSQIIYSDNRFILEKKKCLYVYVTSLHAHDVWECLVTSLKFSFYKMRRAMHPTRLATQRT